MTYVKQIKSGVKTLLTFNIPIFWESTETFVEVKDRNNNSLVEITPATRYAGTILAENLDVYATQATLDAESAALFPGERIRFGSDGEIPEVCEVITYDALTKVVTFTPEVQFAHADGTDVVGMSASYTLDLTDTDKYPINLELYVRWSSGEGSDLATVERFRIGVTQSSYNDIWEEFEALHPTEWASLQKRDLKTFLKSTTNFLKLKLARKALDWDRIQDNELARPGLVAALWYTFLRSSGDRDELEYERARKEFYEWIGDIAALPIWTDEDQDGIMEESEVKNYGVYVARARHN
jgi:hypothetical protein